MLLLGIIFSGLSVALCQKIPSLMISAPNFDDMRSSVNTTWEAMFRQLFSQANRVASVVTLGIKPETKVNTIIIPKCRASTFVSPITYSDTDFVMFFQFVTEETEEYVSYSELCDDAQTGRITSGIAYFNTYMLDKYFDYNTTFSNNRITELIVREIRNVIGFSQQMWGRMTDPVTFVDPDSSYKATGIKIMKLNQALKDHLQFEDCGGEFPVVFNKRGTGFRIPSYLSPQDIQGELIGHEGIQLRSSYYSTGILFASGYFNDKVIFDATMFQLPLMTPFPCEYLKIGCKATIPKNVMGYLYCQDSASSCSHDRQGLGVCTPIPNLPGCSQPQLAMKDNRPVTCASTINNYAQCFTYKIFDPAGETDPTAACYQTNVTLQEDLLAQVKIDNSWVSITSFVEDVTYQGDHNLSTTANNIFLFLNQNFKDCSNRGYSLYIFCFCQSGYGGDYCENKCYDRRCIYCNDSWAVTQTLAHCLSCTSGYTAIADQFCKKDGEYSCPTGCTECLGPYSASECLACDVDNSYIFITDQALNIGKCPKVIQHCTQYDFANPIYCKTCNTGFVPQYLSARSVSRCFVAIANCQVYDYDTSEHCVGCSGSYRVSNDKGSCQPVIINCQTYSSAGSCNDCGANFYTTATACYPRIQYCSDDDGAGKCSSCDATFVLSADKMSCSCPTDFHVAPPVCIEDIPNCLSYPESAPDTCGQCADSYQVSTDKLSCFPVIPNCQTYTNAGNCSDCGAEYYTSARACYKRIPFCSDDDGAGHCSSCQETFLLSADKYSCDCATGYHVATTFCSKDIDNCLTYVTDPPNKCATCATSFRVSNDELSCSTVILNCVTYNDDGTCSDCGPDYYTTATKCFDKIKYCADDDGAGKCGSCQSSFTLAADKGSCYCDTGTHLGVSACYADVAHCQTYDTELGDQCITCASSYELFGTIDAICIVTLDKCTIRVEENPNLCATCVDTYIPNSDKTKCQPKIIGCITFSGMNCAECDSPNFVLQDQDCFWNITGCINQQHQNCNKCGNTYVEVTQENSTNLTCQPCPALNIAINNQCFSIVEGCVTYAHLNNTCLLCDGDMFLDFQNNVCLPKIQGCQLRNPKKASECQVCQNSYQLINGSCSSCTIGQCQSCLNDTQCDSCLQPFQLGKNSQTCLTSCDNQYGLTNCTQCQSATKCSACTTGSFLVGGVCQSCEQSLAYCTSCTLNQCQVCKAGAYLNTKTQYCQPCVSLDANCLLCVENQCLQCQPGYIQIKGVCQTCDSLIKGSLNCAIPMKMKIAYSCLNGYYFSGDYEAPCISCSKYSINCSTCTNQECTSCKDGFYLTNQVCQSCQSSCQTCNNSATCLTCPSGTVMNQDKICTTSIKDFQLSKQPPVDQATTYVIQKQKTITQSALYPVTGTLDSNNYFCSKDLHCNLHGRCQIIDCLCFSGYFGSRCQYSVNSTKQIQTHVSDVLQYLIKLLTIKSSDDFYFRVQILTVISDTSSLMNSGDSEQVYYLLNNYVKYGLSDSFKQNSTIQTALFTCVQQFLQGFTINTNIKVQLLRQVEQLQNVLMQSQTLNQISTPKLRQVSSSYDLKDPDQSKQFISKFQVYRLLQEDECEDTQRILTPTISISQDLFLRIKNAQTNPYDKTNLLLAHIYQNTHIDKHLNTTLYAATTRVEFSIKGTPTSVSNAQPIKIIVPKVNQRDAEIDKNYQCVSWNEQTESWSDQGILGNLTQHCQNYIVCYSTHLSDFTVIYNPQMNNGNPQFDSYAVQTNAAWWLSLSWLILFLLLSLYNYGKYSQYKQSPQIVNRAAVDTEKPDNQELMGAQDNISPRYQPQSINRDWMAFPLYSILCSGEESSASIQIQKICLLTIQLQMFTFITAGFITIDPFIRGVFVVYYLAAIILTWISNYLFGVIAVHTRVKNQVSPAFFFVWFFVFFGLSIVGIYFLWDLDGSHDGFLVLGVFVEIIADLLIFDLLFAVLANNALKLSNKGGILDLVIMRGYLMIQ